MELLFSCLLFSNVQSSVDQGLSPDTSQDALELHIEDMTGAQVVDVKYTKGKTEAIVELNKPIEFGRERNRTIVGNHVKIVRVPSSKEGNITELVRCPPMKQDLLKMMLPHWQSSLPNCSLKRVTEGIELSGISGLVKTAKLELCEQVFRFDRHAISDVDNQRAKLLMSDRGQQELQGLFSKEGIQAVLSVRDDQLWLIATDSHQYSVASKVLEKNLHRFEIPMEDFHQEFLQSADCEEFIEYLERKYIVIVDKRSSTFVVETLGDYSKEIKQQVSNKLEAYTQNCDTIVMEEEEDWKLLKTHHQAEVEALGCRSADG